MSTAPKSINNKGTRATPVGLKVRRNGGASVRAAKAVPQPRRNGKSQGSSIQLEPKTLVEIHDLMAKSRALEERLIKMFKQSDGFFWIGGPGEEGFNVPLGLLANRGQGLDHDYFHLHYRSSAVLIALGADPMDSIRQMKNTATDPYSGGRNFSNHFSKREWNVVPVTSTIETQYATSIGTALAQRRQNAKGLTIVVGGDAGSAEGEFASNLIWSSRPGMELPMLNCITNNSWGISTPAETQHGEKHVSDRAKAFGIETRIINGNDPEESYIAIQEAREYILSEKRPFVIEAIVSRLYGHSSASGANRVDDEDTLKLTEEKLINRNILSEKEIKTVHEKYEQEIFQMAQKVKEEPVPDPESIHDYTFWKQRGRSW